jgi:hypothetical protein
MIHKNKIRSVSTRVSILCGVFGLAIVALSACGDNGRENAVPIDNGDSVPALLETTTTVAPSTTIAPTTTTTLPDLSGVDFVAMARATYGKCGEWREIALSVGWPEEEWEFLSQVIWRESRCQVDAWNGADAGLTQINQIHTEWLSQMGMSHPDDMFNPTNNLYFAYRLWETSGWRPWRFSGPIPE